MTGICGSFNTNGGEFGDLSMLFDEQNKHRYTEGGVAITSITHSKENHPAKTDDGNYAVIAEGDIYGYENKNNEYISKQKSYPGISDSEFCARLLEEFGLSFPKRLNSEFVAVVHEIEEDKLHLITDRLGSWPIYLFEADGGVIFSTNLQCLTRHKDVDTEIVADYLQLYFTHGHVPGIRTPYKDIEMVPPGSVSHVGSKELITNYWSPEYSPSERSPREASETLNRLLKRVFEDRFDEQQRIGMLLSGGSDSRLLLSMLSRPSKGIHMNDWKNKEYEIAKEVATQSDAEFEYYERGKEYHKEVLEEYGDVHEYISEFHQAHAGGFRKRLRKDADILVTGLYADTLLKGHFLPKREVSTPLGPLQLPLLEPIDTVEDFIKYKTRDSPEYVQTNRTISEILHSEIEVLEDGISYFGVEYDSIDELRLCSNFYPITNQPDSLFQQNLHHIQETHFPILDNRIIEFALTIPMKQLIRNPPVNRSIRQQSSELASLPHPETGISLEHSFPVHFISKHMRYLKDKIVESNYPKPYYTDTAWRNTDSFIRHSNLVDEKLREHSSKISNSEFLCEDEVTDIHNRHMNGEDFSSDIYRILSVLEMRDGQIDK